MQNAEAEALTGIKAFSQGINSQSLGSVATGIKSAMDATSKREIYRKWIRDRMLVCKVKCLMHKLTLERKLEIELQRILPLVIVILTYNLYSSVL